MFDGSRYCAGDGSSFFQVGADDEEEMGRDSLFCIVKMILGGTHGPYCIGERVGARIERKTLKESVVA